jgi:DNA helicase-2/ATP-dependent DNA helicase PcrA
LRKKIETNPPQQAIKIIADEIKYFSYLKQEYREYDERYENVKELQQAINDFFNKKEGNFIDFLNEINLYMSSPKENKTQSVKLMTIHFAKGKESDCVFIFDFNNGIIPHASGYVPSNFTGDDDEEERRIAYVGITRAINHLYLTCSSCNESPYLNEIGEKNYKIVTSEISSQPRSEINNFSSHEMYHKTFPHFEIGEIIVHDFFGQGTIIAKKNLDIVVQFKSTYGKQTLKSNHKAIKKLVN